MATLWVKGALNSNRGNTLFGSTPFGYGDGEEGRMVVVYALSLMCLMAPVDGPVVAPYAPVGRYAGHWGVDLAAAVGEPVRSPVAGKITFAGSVAGMRTVTVEPIAGFKVSVSYLADLQATAGQRVERGEVIATAGRPHGRPGVHLSTRVAGRYVDPDPWLRCVATDITRALRLVTPPHPYPRSRAHRDPRGDLRPHPHRPPPRGADRAAPGRTRSSADHARRRSLAEERAWGQPRPAPSRDGETRR
ncbi:MAG: M23 family metallopeptidase [Actinobacteria bacterium]|nr:M23 family metallopeptidase [Actinomycetota bacterium]